MQQALKMVIDFGVSFRAIERLTDWGIRLLNSDSEKLIKLVPTLAPTRIVEKIKEKLGWLADYELDLLRWQHLLSLTRRVESQLKLSGINRHSLKYFQQDGFVFDDIYLKEFHQKVVGYVATQSEKIKCDGTFLATSDVIESLFGKYKQFSARCPMKEMGQMLLTLCLSTMDLTATVVKQALETVSFADVETWVDEVFGQSMLSKRRTLFSTNSNTKTV